MHPHEAEQLSYALTEIESQRRIIAILTHILLTQAGIAEGAELVLTQKQVEHLGACLTGTARIVLDRQGSVRLRVERGRF